MQMRESTARQRGRQRDKNETSKKAPSAAFLRPGKLMMPVFNRNQPVNHLHRHDLGENKRRSALLPVKVEEEISAR